MFYFSISSFDTNTLFYNTYKYMDFLKKIDWPMAITVVVAAMVALYVYDMWFSDKVAEKKAAADMKKA